MKLKSRADEIHRILVFSTLVVTSLWFTYIYLKLDNVLHPNHFYSAHETSFHLAHAICPLIATEK